MDSIRERFNSASSWLNDMGVEKLVFTLHVLLLLNKNKDNLKNKSPA